MEIRLIVPPVCVCVCRMLCVCVDFYGEDWGLGLLLPLHTLRPTLSTFLLMKFAEKVAHWRTEWSALTLPRLILMSYSWARSLRPRAPIVDTVLYYIGTGGAYTSKQIGCQKVRTFQKI